MLILHDEDTLLHETVELLGSKLIPAIESPDRIKALVTACEAHRNHELKRISATADDATTVIELAKSTHDSDYLEHIETVFQQWLDAGLVETNDSVLPECFRLHNSASSIKRPKDIYARAGFYAFDMSCGMTKQSWKSIVASANLAVQAVHDLLPTSDAQQDSVLALCRPPGHHCTPSQAGGYCYLNNVAVAVTALRHYSKVKRVRQVSNPEFSSRSNLKFAILDIDFHHGNGTQEMFWNDPSVLYVSIHGQDEFPYYTGHAQESGPEAPHPAHNTNINFPLPAGSSVEAYLAKLERALADINDFEADYLLISLGFDTFHLDPLGKFEIETEHYAQIARAIRARIRLPTVILLEGGYVIDRLGQNLLSFLDGWETVDGRK